MKPTITVGIPAHNESINIKKLLNSILRQEQNRFDLLEIIVISDGSTDTTVEEVESVKDQRIKLIHFQERGGKAKRLNEIFKIFNGDILVLFDADILITDSGLLEKIANRFIENEDCSLLCCWHKPLPPKTFIERLAVFGVRVWEEAILMLGDKADFYYSVGSIRAFSKNYFKNFEIPTSASAVEDLYTFFHAKSKNWKVIIDNTIVIYYRLPSTLMDYIFRTRRTVRAQSDLRNYFDQELLNKYQVMTESVKLKALFKLMLRVNPLVTFSYAIIQVVPRVLALKGKEKTMWTISASTKKV